MYTPLVALRMVDQKIEYIRSEMGSIKWLLDSLNKEAPVSLLPGEATEPGFTEESVSTTESVSSSDELYQEVNVTDESLGDMDVVGDSSSEHIPYDLNQGMWRK